MRMYMTYMIVEEIWENLVENLRWEKEICGENRRDFRERERINEEEGRRNVLYLMKPTERESSEFRRNLLLVVCEYFWRFAFPDKCNFSTDFRRKKWFYRNSVGIFREMWMSKLRGREYAQNPTDRAYSLHDFLLVGAWVVGYSSE